MHIIFLRKKTATVSALLWRGKVEARPHGRAIPVRLSRPRATHDLTSSLAGRAERPRTCAPPTMLAAPTHLRPLAVARVPRRATPARASPILLAPCSRRAPGFSSAHACEGGRVPCGPTRRRPTTARRRRKVASPSPGNFPELMLLRWDPLQKAAESSWIS